MPPLLGRRTYIPIQQPAAETTIPWFRPMGKPRSTLVVDTCIRLKKAANTCNTASLHIARIGLDERVLESKVIMRKSLRVSANGRGVRLKRLSQIRIATVSRCQSVLDNDNEANVKLRCCETANGSSSGSWAGDMDWLAGGLSLSAGQAIRYCPSCLGA